MAVSQGRRVMANRHLYLLAKKFVISVEKERERANFVEGEVEEAEAALLNYLFDWEPEESPCTCGDPGDCAQC